MLNWVQQFNTFSFLDNHQYQADYHSQECLLGAGVRYSSGTDSAPRLLQQFIDAHRGQWLFGHIGYHAPVGRDIIQSRRQDYTGFRQLSFFVPQIVLSWTNRELRITGENPRQVYEEIMATAAAINADTQAPPVQLRQRSSREEYIHIIQKLLEHIRRGDCYEINFCQEFYAPAVQVNPLAVYQRLSAVSPSPFSALYRAGDSWLVCASPERYLKKQGSRLYSQPIKGTSQRMPGNTQLDEAQKQWLAQSSKDRSENVMIVDLVRNDLARICKEGTVRVDELYGIYSFPQVHQMISTISGELDDGISFTDILAATFPMGSMTGAPKKKVMELIDRYEPNSRGLFSGTIGYISPEGDFDFNVVIRSILYNAANGYLSMPAGSGITFYSDPQQEWEECLLKAEAMKRAVS